MSQFRASGARLLVGRDASSSLMKRVLFGCVLALALFSIGGYASFHGLHIGRNETVLIHFNPDDDPPKTDLGLVSRLGNHSIQACCTHSTAILNDFEGARGSVRKFEIRSSDERVRAGFRSELRLRPNYMHQAFWYQARMFVPQDWASSTLPIIAMQWHNTRDFFLGEVGTIPPLALDITDNRWRVVKAWDRRWVSTATPPRVEGHRVIAIAPMIPGRWVEWTFHVNWTPDDDGFVKVWMDGVPLVNLAGPIGHRDLIGPYLKVGLYTPSWKGIAIDRNVESRILYFDLVAASAFRSKLPSMIHGE